ncbi:MAG: sigma-70 family RNA polymerase sigma factor [Saprospiraceae bacterium]
MSNYTENQLLQGIREGNKKIIEFIFQNHQSRIIILLQKYGATLEESEDHFMDGLEAIYNKVTENQDFILEQASFNTYLSKVCINLWLKTARRKKFTSEVTIDEVMVQMDSPDQIELINEMAKVKLFREKLKLLSNECQQLIKMSFNETNSMKDIALAMNYTDGFVRKKKHDCKEKLMKMVKEDSLYKELI